MTFSPPRFALALSLLAAAACGNARPPSGPPGSGGNPGQGGNGGSPVQTDAGTDTGGNPDLPPLPPDPATGLPLHASAAAMQELASLRASLAASPKTAAELSAARAVSFLDKLPYDPAKAAYLDKLQASPLALNPAELTALGTRGFALTSRPKFLNFIHGYRAIYAEHLPLYVSADSILYALHRSYDAMLRTLEETTLIARLETLLQGLRTRLPATKVDRISSDATKDVDLYLAVALALLEGKAAAPVAGADAAEIATWVGKASSDNGTWEAATIFGQVRQVDFSQFKPRGHYTRSDALKNYFRAMIWLGRTEFRLIETLEDGRQVFRRRQMEGALLVRALVDTGAAAQWKSIDDVVRAFVGEPDDVTLPDLDRLVTTDAPGLLAMPDQTIAQLLLDGGYGAQRISSQIMVNGLDQDTLPLHRAFLLFGQRYILDSNVFSNVVYDRVKKASVKRMMPNPLDVAFGALGNDAAVALLGPELTKYDYATKLADVRALGDGHGDAFWTSNLYNLWLSALRALSPAHDLRGAVQAGLPSITATEPWSRRILNTQMASWAELRHDTILYSKQSYTGAPACDFPDAYVDPYPAFWAKLADLAKQGGALIIGLGITDSALAARMIGYFAKLEEVARLLGDMAERQRTGVAFNQAQLVFINQTVSIMPFGCGGSIASGWYPGLFFDQSEALNFDPTVADVHTQPADEGGGKVGKVLHVATGKPRLMVVTVDGCSGPRAYTGLASAYFETITSDFKRLDDKEWASTLQAPTAVPEVPWMSDLVNH
jgi:hypothetical protein